MYTVLLLDNRTLESFEGFKPLFADAIKDGQLDVVTWNANELTDGTHDCVEKAIPGIYELVGDKKEWRAMIVQSYIGAEEGPLAVDRRNPFNYKANEEAWNEEKRRFKKAHAEFEDEYKRRKAAISEKIKRCEEEQIEIDFKPLFDELEEFEKKNRPVENLNMTQESSIPLVRIAQMLAGVPTPDPIIRGYSEYNVDTLGTTKRVHVEADSENEPLFHELKKAYRFHANPPKELILVAARPSLQENLGIVKEYWANHDELESSQFWLYNHYPQCCRFMTYEVEEKGRVQEQGDLFRLWLTIGLIAANSLDPSSFQAYRLYRMEIKIDRELLTESFRSTYLKLTAADKYLRKSIEYDKKRKKNDRIDPPDYEVYVDVTVEDERIGSTTMNQDDYELAARDFEEDASIWTDNKNSVDDNIRKLRRMTGRAVENSAERMREIYGYSEEEVEPLSDFQAREFKDALKATYQEVLDNQAALPFGMIGDLQKRKEDQNRRVLEIIKSRMSAARILIGYGITCVMMLVAVLPSLVRAISNSQSVLIPILGSLAAAAIIYLIAEVIVVRVQYKELCDGISIYNSLVRKIREMIDNNAKSYSRFLSSVGSHMNGSSYINTLRHKTFMREDITEQKRRHLKSIGDFLLHIEGWAKAVYITFDFFADDEDEIEVDDMEILEFDSLYTLESGKSYQVPMNQTGHYLTSAYSFIESLKVVREEIYDSDIDTIDNDGDPEQSQ